MEKLYLSNNKLIQVQNIETAVVQNEKFNSKVSPAAINTIIVISVIYAGISFMMN